MVAYAQGLVGTREGRRIIAVLAVGVLAAAALSSEAIQGVEDRFTEDREETRGRFEEALQYLPPLAILFTDYPVLGLGTGNLQNAALVSGYRPPVAAENEQARLLIEQGVVGYLLVSCVRIGILIALIRAGTVLKRRGRRAEAGVAWALAVFSLPGNLFFDHVFQALFFLGSVLSSRHSLGSRTNQSP